MGGFFVATERCEKRKKALKNAADYVNREKREESANHIALHFSLIFYFVLLVEVFLQYIFIDSTKWKYIFFWGLAAAILLQVAMFFIWRDSRNYGRGTIILFFVVFTYANLITRGDNMVLLLPIPMVALCILYLCNCMLVFSYIMWGINCLLRYMQIIYTGGKIEQYKAFAWIIMICMVYAVVVYMVNGSLGHHYREVCYDLHHENKLHTKLYQQSTVDTTTGLLNRNSYNTYLSEYSEGDFDCISCIYIDVNGLHEYNNTYGHQAGDKMLKMVASNLKDCFSEHTQYRIGGDEFVIISENVAFKSVLANLKTFREQMKEHNIHIASGMEWRDENMNLADMIKKADAKMYQDKERFYNAFPNGRESVTLYKKAVE